MMKRKHSARGGFSLVELMVALTITAVIGVSMMTLFMTQARFLEMQQKTEFARGVARSATNIMMSELRMVDRDSGVVSETDTSLTIRVPFAMGLVCAVTAASITISMFPVDSMAFAADTAAFGSGFAQSQGGYAYRQSNGKYKYVALTTLPAAGVTTLCTTPGISVLTSEGGSVKVLTTAGAVGAAVGAPVFLYHKVRYHFNASTSVSGRLGLYRKALNVDEEVVAPFDTSARFYYFVDDAKNSVATPPTNLARITGIDIVLNSINEKPNPDGTYTVVPLRTAVFFKNRRN